MLQTSQIEKPRCSAKIDHMRLRRAMNLPSDFQNSSSSGFQFEIHIGLRLLIKCSFPVGPDSPAARAPTGVALARPVPTYPTEKSSISARRKGEDCTLLRRCGMSLCNANFSTGSDQNMGASAPLDALRTLSWHAASLRCGAKIRTRSERSGHAESV